MTNSDSENQENIFMWAIRYVLIPVTLAVMAGYFALAVVDRQFELQNGHQNGEAIDAVFATMTAVASQESVTTPTPASTPTIQPTPTQEASVDETGEPVAAVPVHTVPPIISPPCGQVPVGWSLYTVQPGNTLFSLARETGTTVGTIRQANCLYGQLIAFSQIWLPQLPLEQPEPATEEPPITITPTSTVTEPVALPDLINDTRDWPTLRQTCGVAACMTTITFAVGNNGAATAESFDIALQFDSEPAVTLNQFVTNLEPDAGEVFSLTSLELNSCYLQGCTVCITVDSGSSVAEEDEGNNQYCTTFQEQGAG